jgi:hypothetical protein
MQLFMSVRTLHVVPEPPVSRASRITQHLTHRTPSGKPLFLLWRLVIECTARAVLLLILTWAHPVHVAQTRTCHCNRAFAQGKVSLVKLES